MWIRVSTQQKYFVAPHKVGSGSNLLWLKMRPDTPQHYEYITLENIEGNITNFININPWTQFFDLKDRKGYSAVLC